MTRSFPARTILISLFLFALGLSAARDARPADDLTHTIRVCVVDRAERIVLSVRRSYTVTAPSTGQKLAEGKHVYTEVSLSKDGIVFRGKAYGVGWIRVVTGEDGNIFVNERCYRGAIDIIRTADTKLVAVNVIDVDRYLYGVLYHEVSHLWPMEVLKAQAIVARTFAYYQRRAQKARDYDVRSDIYSQVYGGRESERPTTNRAVDQTKDEVLAWGGELFPAYYHATCGGHTEDAARLWNIDIAPLKGVACPFCVGSPHFRWQRAIPLAEVRLKLEKAGHAVGSIGSIEVLSRDESRRIDALEVVDGSGARTVITGKDFRQALGPNLIRSTNFKAQIRADEATFKGFGWGHGVGMCQWGAYGLTRKGWTAEAILKHYYPGAEIVAIGTLSHD